MYIETITSGREDWSFLVRGTRLTTDPPERLVLSVARDAGNDRVTVLDVWDSGEAIADFYLERTCLLIEQRGESADEPQRHEEPLEVCVRG